MATCSANKIDSERLTLPRGGGRPCSFAGGAALPYSKEKFGFSHSALLGFKPFHTQLAPSLCSSLSTAHELTFGRYALDTLSKQNGAHATQMELTVDQALKEAIAAHKEGKLQDAERLYRAILEAQPSHPDANHNLGVLAVAVGKHL